MANRLVGAAAGLIGGQVAGRVLSVWLGSRAGARLLDMVDRRPLTPLEHRVIVQKWSGNLGRAISGGAAALAVVWAGRPDATERLRHMTMSRRGVDWVQVLNRTAEVMLAIGAIFKVAGQFLEERQKIALETQRAAAKP